MRTSHKTTHTQPLASRLWLRLLVLTVLLGSTALVAVRTEFWSVSANELEAARVRLEKAQADHRAKPSEQTRSSLQEAMKSYKEALVASPVAAASFQGASPFEGRADGPVISAKLSDLAPPPPDPSSGKKNKIRGEKNVERVKSLAAGAGGGSGAVQSSPVAGQTVVTPGGVGFDGLTAVQSGQFAPPDTIADVGLNHIIETVNVAFRIFNKNGTPATGVLSFETFFAPIGGATASYSDPIILYDSMADRYVILMWDTNRDAQNRDHMHIAVSLTGDATGSYYLYNFPMPAGRTQDYPHLGVWTDGYYMTTNNFRDDGGFGGGMFSFNRAAMLAGLSANFIFFEANGIANDPNNPFGANGGDGGMLPTDLDGVALPPAGTPGTIMSFFADEFGGGFTDSVRIYEFSPNFTNPAASTVIIKATVPVTAFDARQPNSRANIEQPAPGEGLDSIGDRLMHRLAYRTLDSGAASYVLNWTVNVSGVNPTTAATYQAAVKWAELRRSGGGTYSLNADGIYATGAGNGATGANNWMAALAQDHDGNIGLGMSRSSTTVNPSIFATGRFPTDPAGVMGQGEITLKAGGGVQTATANRWGDYSSMSVDPVDECTFWYAQEYYAATGSFAWNTWIANFKVNPACAPAAKGTIQGLVTNLSQGGAAVANASATANGGIFRSTNATGNYSMIVAPGTYNMSITKLGFSTCTGTVTVAAGGTATFNCALQGIPIPNAGTGTLTAEDCSVDGKPDPGETVTASLPISNTGGANTANLVATLLATGGVTNPSGPQNYGVVVAGGAAVARSFTFRASPSLICGSNVVLTLQLQDGASNLGTLTYTFQTGTRVVTLTENFDGVTAPALPSGWTATNAVGPAPLWVTSTTTPDSAPNAAFVNDPAVLSDKLLETPAVLINSSSAQVSFRNNFNLEGGFDGGVLEASVNGAAYVDVTNAAVGGSFVAGGYTAAISTGFSSPIGGRQAWTGNSAGYITSTVQFGAALNNKTVKFRFRMASDTTVAGVGWRVDGFQILGDLVCCTMITPVVTTASADSCNGPGTVVTVTTRVANPTASMLSNGSITTSLPPALLGVSGSCTATVDGVASGTCVVSSSAANWTGSLAGGKTVVIRFDVQVGDANPGANLCMITAGGFTGINLTPVQTCVPVNCPGLGPGSVIPTQTGEGPAALSDQKPGSVLLYPVYTSSVDPNIQNARISMTNVNPAATAYVHLFFVDGSSCSVADAFICLTPNQTISFLASDLDPGTTGYLVAIAVNRDGCPINFNYLMGDEYVKFSTGHQASLGAEAIPALAGSVTACPGATVDVRFDGVSYGFVPRTLALDNVGSRTDGNDTLVIINRIGGDLLTTAATLVNLFGQLYDDQEVILSFSVNPRTCQFRSTVSNNFPRTTPRFEQFVPAGRTGWFKFAGIDDIGIFGAAINNNNNFAASGGAFRGGHNLHKLTFTSSMRYTIPVLPVSCQ